MTDRSPRGGDDGSGGTLRRRQAMKALGSVGAASLLTGCPASESSSDGSPRSTDTETPSGGDRRNVVFVLSDDHRHDFMNFVDGPATPTFLETPNFDRMARGGAHLRNAFVTTSLCAPSRASILTGQYAHQHGVVDNKHLVEKQVPFFPELLQRVGYETAFVGKWHQYQSDDAGPRPGFDHWVSFEGQGTYRNPQFNVNGERVEREGHLTDLLTEFALEWLRSREGDRPFFLYLSHKAVHHPFRPTKRHRGQYADEPVDRPATASVSEETFAGKPEWVRKRRPGREGIEVPFGGATFEGLYRRYCETLLGLDESVGAVLDYLDDSGLAEETLALYMGDNGYLLGEHGLFGKIAAYEPSMRVPLLAYAPGLVDPGTVVDDLVTNVDVAPTVLHEADHPTPDYAAGRSFRPLLRSAPTKWRDGFLYEYFWSGRPQIPTTFALRTERFKYVWYHGAWYPTNELYDLRADPAERRNRIDAPALQSRVDALHERLFDALEALDGMQIPLYRQERRPSVTGRKGGN